MCRICHQYSDALKWVLSELLLAYKFRQEPHTNNSNAVVEILWNCTDRRLEEEEAYRADLVVTDRRKKVVNVVEMACPSWRNRRKTDTRKTEKYRTVRRELMERNEGFSVQQTNIVVDVLGGYDREVKDDLNSLLGRSKGPFYCAL